MSEKAPRDSGENRVDDEDMDGREGRDRLASDHNPAADTRAENRGDRQAPKRDMLDLGRKTVSSGKDDKSSETPEDDAEGGRADRKQDQPDKGENSKPGKKEEDDNPPKPPPKLVFVIAGLILLAAVAWGGFEHWRSYEASKQTADGTVNRPVEVRTTEAQRLDQPIDLTLPGETQAFDTANIYARATGYISERRVDIGSRVKQGDLLIHIAAPDLDQQLVQAEAQIGQTRAALVQAQALVSQAEANVNLAKVNFARTNQLTQQGYESQQNRDQRDADVKTQESNVASARAGVTVAEANVKAQEANIDRLKALAAFEDVRAPFDGVVTARNVDLGELVNADSSNGSPMFTVVRDSIIRVIVRVPQTNAEGIHQGLEAKVVVSQMPNRSFSGRVQRNSVALLYSSRTLTTEVDVPNDTGDLRPGLYVSVSFAVPRDKPDVSVPAEALMFDQHGIRVASVDGDVIKLNQINIYRDHGATVDLREGLKGGERIVLNPPATLKDGAKVKEIREEDEKKKDEEDKTKNKKGGSSGQASAPTDDGTKQAKADEPKESR